MASGPTKRGDVSPTLVFNSKMMNKPIAHKRKQALDKAAGDFEKANPNSAAIWDYKSEQFQKSLSQTIGNVTIANDLLFVADLSGRFHCLDVKSGKRHWTYDMQASCWGSPLIVDDRVYIANEDGDILIFELSEKQVEIGKINMGGPMYSTLIVANATLFVATPNRLFAIQEEFPPKKP